MKLKDYKLDPQSWPPPRSMRNPDHYLFGWDEDNQPYVVRYEHARGYEGWIAATLNEHKSSGARAVPRHYTGDTVDKLLKFWTQAPCTKDIVEKYKKRDED